MSEQNVETVRRFVDHWARLDWRGISELVDPQVEQHTTVGGLEEGRVMRGLDEIRREYESSEEMWDEHRIHPEELIDAGDRVVLLHREFQRGRGSGVELELEAAVVFDLRDGRIVRIQGYMDRAAALEAAGVAQ